MAWLDVGALSNEIEFKEEIMSFNIRLYDSYGMSYLLTFPCHVLILFNTSYGMEVILCPFGYANLNTSPGYGVFNSHLFQNKYQVSDMCYLYNMGDITSIKIESTRSGAPTQIFLKTRVPEKYSTSILSLQSTADNRIHFTDTSNDMQYSINIGDSFKSIKSYASTLLVELTGESIDAGNFITEATSPKIYKVQFSHSKMNSLDSENLLTFKE